MKQLTWTKTQLKQCAALQPLAYFKKYESILINNLLVALHKANYEKNRGLEYYMTWQILIEVNCKPILMELFFLGDIIETKIKLKIRTKKKSKR